MQGHRIAFNMANFVARFSGYRFKLSDWGRQHRLTVERTDEKEFTSMCGEIAAAGYHAVELWAAHLDPPRMTDQRTRTFADILSSHSLKPIGFAGTLDEGTARVCRAIGVPAANGGMEGRTADQLQALAETSGLGFNFENHPEKSAGEIRARIDGGRRDVGLCIDTGWLGTQGLDAARVIRELGPLIRHVHLKDVRGVDKHETCRLGEGVVDVPAVIVALKQIGYTGWYSWEDEPEDRNPMEIATEMRQWIERQLTG